MRTITPALFLILTGALWACASTAPKQPWSAPESGSEPAPERGSDWLTEAMSAEVNLPSAQSYEFAFLRGEALSRTPLVITQKTEGMLYVKADIGSSTPVECYAYTDDKDVAKLTVLLADGVIDEIGKRYGGVEAKQIAATDAGAKTGHPWLAADWAYRVAGTGKGAIFFYLKLATVRFGSHVVSCLHNQTGFRESFRKWFEHFVAHGELTDQSGPEPAFVELSTEELNGVRVGFSGVKMTTDGDGDSRIDRISSMILPRASADPLASDGRSVTFVGSDGHLINGVYVDTLQDFSIKLDPTEQGYRAHGNLSGKAIDFQLSTDTPLDSDFQIDRAIRRAARTEGLQRFQRRVFVPATPDRIQEISVEEKPKNSDGLHPFAMVLGPMKVTALYNDKGESLSANIEVGNANVRSVVVFRAGSI